MESTKRTFEHATAIGRHLLVDMYEIDAQLLQDERYLLDLLVRALKAAGFSILTTRSHKFHESGYGVTAFALLTESHATIHTYPERQYLALDIFSCGQPDPQEVLDMMVSELQPGECVQSAHPRGDRMS